jgi:hypothetical protein
MAARSGRADLCGPRILDCCPSASGATGQGGRTCGPGTSGLCPRRGLRASCGRPTRAGRGPRRTPSSARSARRCRKTHRVGRRSTTYFKGAPARASPQPAPLARSTDPPGLTSKEPPDAFRRRARREVYKNHLQAGAAPRRRRTGATLRREMEALRTRGPSPASPLSWSWPRKHSDSGERGIARGSGGWIAAGRHRPGSWSARSLSLARAKRPVNVAVHPRKGLHLFWVSRVRARGAAGVRPRHRSLARTAAAAGEAGRPPWAALLERPNRARRQLRVPSAGGADHFCCQRRSQDPGPARGWGRASPSIETSHALVREAGGRAGSASFRGGSGHREGASTRVSWPRGSPGPERVWTAPLRSSIREATPSWRRALAGFPACGASSAARDRRVLRSCASSEEQPPAVCHRRCWYRYPRSCRCTLARSARAARWPSYDYLHAPGAGRGTLNEPFRIWALRSGETSGTRAGARLVQSRARRGRYDRLGRMDLQPCSSGRHSPLFANRRAASSSSGFVSRRDT